MNTKTDSIWAAAEHLLRRDAAVPLQITAPPNIEGETQLIVRWLVETPAGRVGAWNRAALEYLLGSIPAQATPAAVAGPSWSDAANWLRNNYQDYPNIASLCEGMIAALPYANATYTSPINWENAMPGGKYTDKWESTRVADYNRGWNDYRKEAHKKLKAITAPTTQAALQPAAHAAMGQCENCQAARAPGRAKSPALPPSYLGGSLVANVTTGECLVRMHFGNAKEAERWFDAATDSREAAPKAAPAQCPTSVDAKTMELAESVGLIGPASRTHDLHAAIQRFHDLVCVNATIKAAQMASDAIREAAPAAQGDSLDSDRLNWLEANAQITIERLCRIGSEKRVYEVASNDDEIYGVGDTLRAAIDAARAAKEGGRND